MSEFDNVQRCTLKLTEPQARVLYEILNLTGLALTEVDTDYGSDSIEDIVSRQPLLDEVNVKRVAHRLGLTDETEPVKVERDLMEVLEPDQWHPFAWRLILHGRTYCKSRKPVCGECPVRDSCPSADAFD